MPVHPAARAGPTFPLSQRDDHRQNAQYLDHAPQAQWGLVADAHV
jgi:hypothetical protein